MDSLKTAIASSLISLASSFACSQDNPFFEIISETAPRSAKIEVAKEKLIDVPPSPYEERFQVPADESPRSMIPSLGPAIAVHEPTTWPTVNGPTCPQWRTTPLYQSMQDDPCSANLWGHYPIERACRHARQHRFVHGTCIHGNCGCANQLQPFGDHQLCSGPNWGASASIANIPPRIPNALPQTGLPSSIPQSSPVPYRWVAYPYPTQWPNPNTNSTAPMRSLHPTPSTPAHYR